MSWRTIHANTNVEGHPWIKIGVHSRSGYEQVKLTMSRTIVDHLGVKTGEKVMVRWGQGDHYGWIQIQPSPPWYDRGFMLTNRKTAAGNLSFRSAAGHFDLKHHPTVKVTTDGAGLIMTEEEGINVVQLEIPESMRGGIDGRS